MTTATHEPTDVQAGPGPMVLDRPEGENVIVKAFVVLPFLALLGAVPLAWGWGLSWVDVGPAVFFYFLTLGGATVGYHRYFTHRSFKARRPLRIGLAIVGSMALQGPVITWVADHRRHHAFTDREGDPHSPWLFGTTPAAVAKGFWHSHFGWMLHHDVTNPARFAPDLLADPDIARISRQFPLRTAASLLAPALLGGVITWSWWGALTAFFWAGLVRVGGAAPRHLVGQLDLPHDRQPALDPARPVHKLLATGHRDDGPVVAQPAPRRPHLRSTRRRPRTDRHVRPNHRRVRGPRVGPRRALAHPAPTRPPRRDPQPPGLRRPR